VVDAHGAEGGDVEAEGVQVFEGFAAQKFSTDLMAGFCLALDEGDAAALAGERDGSGAAGDAAAKDEDFILYGEWFVVRGVDGKLLELCCC
jgi:hypothetical protein